MRDRMKDTQRSHWLGPLGSQDTAEKGEGAERKGITPETSIKYLLYTRPQEDSSEQDKSRQETYSLVGRQ